MTRSLKKHHFATLDSTQTWAKNNLSSVPLNELACIVADMQTQGIGTHGRKWMSPPGVNIHATFVFSLRAPCPFLANISQVISLSCICVLSEMGFHPQCKWPNDLILHEKKLAGILTEVVSKADNHLIFVGVGINVNMEQKDLEQIDQPATSLFSESGHLVDKATLLDKLSSQICYDISLLEKKGFVAFKKAYEDHILYLHESVVLKKDNHTYHGVFLGVDDAGRLILEKENKERLTLSSADRMFKKS